ncbi:MAG TPA: response regulator [Verrucomicrobiae bacterium]|nr:response regulator [Verrucomicrobiae bacterium]
MSTGSVSPQKQVLAIDDEPEVLDVIKRCLELDGVQVLTASRPKQGLELYEKHRGQIGLVLLDYLMPDMTGDLVFECLQRTNPDVHVILLTGCDDNVAKRMFEEGLRGYIQKPFYVEDFLARVREELNQL